MVTRWKYSTTNMNAPILRSVWPEGVTLANKWNTFVIPFAVPKTETNGRLRFWFVGHANKGDKFEIRNVKLQQILQD